MSVSKRYFTIFLFGILACIGRGVQLTAKAHGIELILAYGYIGPREGISFLDGSVYLKNCSDTPLSVVVGPILGPQYSTGSVTYSVVLTSENEDITIKPSPGSLDITELKPGELTKLEHFRISTAKAYEQKIVVIYRIDRALPKFYPTVWAHELSVTVPIK